MQPLENPYQEATIYPEIEAFNNWLVCEYPTPSTSAHYHSDLVLFFCSMDIETDKRIKAETNISTKMR